jgi:pilus assembly protein CpaE
MPDVTTQAGWQPGDEIRLVVALTSWTDETAIVNAFGFQTENPSHIRVMSRVSSLPLLLDAVKEYDPHVVMIDHQLGQGNGAGELLAQIIQKMRHFPEHPIIVIGVCYDLSWKKEFEDAGASGTLRGPLDAGELQRFVELLPSAVLRAYEERISPSYIQRFSEAAVRAIDSGMWQRRTVTFWSTKGGVGKTWLAVETAVALGVLCDRRVLLIDADMNCGDVATVLKLKPDRNIVGLATTFAANRNRLTPQMVQQHLVPFKGNLSVLVGAYAMKIAGADVVNGAQGAIFADELINTIQSMGFDFVIWDLGQSFHMPLHLVPLKRSDLNLIVVTPERTTLLEMQLSLPDLVQDVEITPDRFRLVINRWSDDMGVSAREIVSHLALPEFARIPYGTNQCVDLAIQHAQPLMLQKPNNVSDALVGMIKGMYRPIEPVWQARGGDGQRRGLFRFTRKPPALSKRRM